jgi:hypothetical protein
VAIAVAGGVVGACARAANLGIRDTSASTQQEDLGAPPVEEAPAGPSDLVQAGLPPSARVIPSGQGETGGGEAGSVAAQATPLPADLTAPGVATRRIVKNADLVIEVDGVERAIGRITTAAATVGGYVLDTKTDMGEGGPSRAVVQISVPVDRFEETLEAIRREATRVHSEHASGTDVTQEYVDIQSQIANLEATQARVRQFLDQAKNVEEALQVNARLTEIEGQLSQLKGRLQYLGQRSAFSTITVEIVQSASALTPTPTPTPEPLPPWNPGQTTRDALAVLRELVQALGDLAIWITIVFVPVLLPIAIGIWLLKRWRGKRSP